MLNCVTLSSMEFFLQILYRYSWQLQQLNLTSLFSDWSRFKIFSRFINRTANVIIVCQTCQSRQFDQLVSQKSDRWIGSWLLRQEVRKLAGKSKSNKIDYPTHEECNI